MPSAERRERPGFGRLLEQIARRAAPPADARMRLLSCFLERGVEEALREGGAGHAPVTRPQARRFSSCVMR